MTDVPPADYLNKWCLCRFSRSKQTDFALMKKNFESLTIILQFLCFFLWIVELSYWSAKSSSSMTDLPWLGVSSKSKQIVILLWFQVQGELVGLRDNLAAMATPAVPTRKYNVVHNGVDPSPSVPRAPPKTPPATRRNIPPKTPPTVRRSKSFSEQRVTGEEDTFSFAICLRAVRAKNNTPYFSNENLRRTEVFICHSTRT